MNREYFDGAFYFGCIGQTGHYLWNTCGNTARSERLPKDFPQRSLTYGPVADGVFAPNLPDQKEGIASVWHGNGWTILAFWDRSVDGRYGCSSTFYLRGDYDFDAALQQAQQWFPFVWERFKFKVTEHKPA